MERPKITDFEIVNGVLDALFRYPHGLGTFAAVHREAHYCAVFWIENFSIARPRPPPAPPPSPAVVQGGGDD